MRDQILDLLARLVADGLLTEDEARELLRQFDAGELMEWEMPLSSQESVKGFDPLMAGLIAAALLALLGSKLSAPSAIGPRLIYANTLQAQFTAQASVLAGNLVGGNISLVTWQQGMITVLQNNLAQAVMAGSGRTALTTRQTQQLNTLMRQQTAYLSRFADQIALRRAQGNPFGVEYLANRAAQYGGAGRGLFFEESERAAIEDGTIGAGWLVYFISHDDSGTCLNCLDADHSGPYLPGAPHPQPGIVCLGRAHCRCRLEWRYEPELYRRLAG